MNSRVLTFCGSLMLAAGCDSPGPLAPTAKMPPAAVPAPPGPFGPASNPVIVAGTPIEGTIAGTDPVCFPNWDATGHCRQYDFVAPSDGAIVATLTWTGTPQGLYDPEVFLAAPNGQWEFATGDWPEKHVSISVRSGVTYRVVVLSYGESELRFGLRVDV